MSGVSPFIDCWSYIPECRMPALPIIEHFEPLKESRPSLIASLESVLGQELTF